MGAASIVLAGSQLGGAFSQSQALKTQGEFDQFQAETNARFAEIQAEDIIRKGDVEAREHQKKVRLSVGAQRAALAAQGIQVDSGSAFDLQRELAETGVLDTLTIRNNAFRQAFGFEQQAISDRFQGRFDRSASDFKSRSTLITGGLSAVGTGLSGFDKKKGS